MSARLPWQRGTPMTIGVVTFQETGQDTGQDTGEQGYADSLPVRVGAFGLDMPAKQ